MPDVGQTVRVQARWTANRVPADPDTVVARVRAPDGALTYPPVTHVEVGVDTVEVALTRPGIWWVRFEGTDPVPTADELPIEAEHSKFWPLPALELEPATLAAEPQLSP